MGRLSRLAAALVAVAVSAAPLALAPSQPAEAAPRVATGYSVTPLNDKLADAIRSAPCGSGGRVDIVLHNTGDWTLTKAVIDRANCGTKMRLVTWYHKQGGSKDGPLQLAQTQMRNAIRAHGGTFVACRGACLLGPKGNAGIEHEKLVLVRNGSQWLVISDSGNWTDSNDVHLNDRMVVDDRCLYASSLAHVDQLAQDRAPRKPIRYSQSCDGGSGKRVRVYWNPVANADPALDWARKATCGRGATVVWSNSIVSQGKSSRYGSGYRLATELIRFRKAGARVTATANREHWSRPLEDRLRRAGVTISHERKGIGYRHPKTLAAVGCSRGGPFLEQGSTTRNSTAVTKNGNQTLVSTRPADAAAAVSKLSGALGRW